MLVHALDSINNIMYMYTVLYILDDIVGSTGNNARYLKDSGGLGNHRTSLLPSLKHLLMSTGKITFVPTLPERTTGAEDL